MLRQSYGVMLSSTAARIACVQASSGHGTHTLRVRVRGEGEGEGEGEG